jgi:hypothetical protein
VEGDPTSFDVLSRHLRGQTEEHHDKHVKTDGNQMPPECESRMLPLHQAGG